LLVKDAQIALTEAQESITEAEETIKQAQSTADLAVKTNQADLLSEQAQTQVEEQALLGKRALTEEKELLKVEAETGKTGELFTTGYSVS